MKYNRRIAIDVREIVNGVVGALPLPEFTFDEQASNDYNPYDIKVNINQSITSVGDTASIIIQNPLVIEQLYRLRDIYLTTITEKDYIVNVSAAYADEPLSVIFSGDLAEIDVTPSNNINDNGLTLRATSGMLAMSKAKLKAVFLKGQPYRDIVLACFEVLAGFGIELTVLDDPFNKLDKLIEKDKSKDRSVNEVLNDVCRELDMCFGFNTREDVTGVQKGFFIDKRSAMDITGDGLLKQISYQTGSRSLPSFGDTDFSFTHGFDRELAIGKLVEVSLLTSTDIGTLFPGRIKSLSTRLSSRDGSFTQNVVCDFSDGTLAKLNDDRRNVGAELL